MEVVIAEWGGQRFRAVVDSRYDIAVVVGAALEEFEIENEGEGTMNHDDLEQRYQKLENEFAGLKALFAAQQLALEKLGLTVKGHQKIIEAATGHYEPPSSARPSGN